jgi:hypothetical protein
MATIAVLAGCAAKQEKPPTTTQLQGSIEQFERAGFKCREAAARPMPMGHTVVCSKSEGSGVTLQADNEGKLTAVRTFGPPAAKP